MEKQQMIEKATKKFKEILFDILHLDEYCDKQHLKDTPKRIAKMWVNELLSGVYTDPDDLLTTFSFENAVTNVDQVIVVKDIEVKSLCSHHFMPFYGTCNIAYVPGTRILGLSKFSRIVKHFSRRPQVQEGLTEDIAVFIHRKLNPKAVAVKIKAKHLCMSHRGIESDGYMITEFALTDYEYRYLRNSVIDAVQF